MDDPDRLLDYNAAADLTAIQKTTLASMVSRRQIPHLRVSTRIVRFSRRELLAWLAERRVPVKGTFVPGGR